MPPFSASSAAPREEGKNGVFQYNHFPSSFLNHFESFGIVLVDLVLGIKWAGFPLFFWALDLVDGFWPFLFMSWLPWITGPDGLWIWSAVDRKKTGLYI
jgi:hypothetical protein